MLDEAFVMGALYFGQTFGVMGGGVEGLPHFKGDHFVVGAVDNKDGTIDGLECGLGVV